MKTKLAEYFTEGRIVSHRERNSQNDADQASFDKSFKNSIKYVEKHKEAIAYEMACDWEEHKFRCKQAETEQAADSRNQRADRLIELGKSYRPAAEPRRETAEPGQSARHEPSALGGTMLKTGWGSLFETHGDKPVTVRPGEPFKNRFPDDPDRSHRGKNRDDFDVDR